MATISSIYKTLTPEQIKIAQQRKVDPRYITQKNYDILFGQKPTPTQTSTSVIPSTIVSQLNPNTITQINQPQGDARVSQESIDAMKQGLADSSAANQATPIAPTPIAPTVPATPIPEVPAAPITPTTPTAPNIPDVDAQRQAILEQMRQRLGIQKQSQNEAILKSAEQAKRDIQSRYLQGKAGELERLVNQGLASGMQGAEQSGQARNEILQRQLASENQANAVSTQAQADVSALDRQYNDLIAQGDIEGAKQAIEDAWKKYQYDQQNYQFGQTQNLNQAQLDEQKRQNQVNEQMQRDQLTMSEEQFQLTYGLNKAQFEEQKRQQDIDNEYRQKQADIQNKFNTGQMTLAQKELALKQLQAERDYRMAQAQIGISQQNANTSAQNAIGSGGSNNTGAWNSMYGNNP